MLLYVYGKDGVWYKGRHPHGEIKTTPRIKDAYLFAEDEKESARDCLNRGFKLFSLELTEPRAVGATPVATSISGKISHGVGVYRDPEKDTTWLELSPACSIYYNPSVGLYAMVMGEPRQGVTTNFNVYSQLIQLNKDIFVDGPHAVAAAALYLSNFLELVGYLSDFQSILIPSHRELRVFCEAAGFPINTINFWRLIQRDSEKPKLYTQSLIYHSCFISDSKNILGKIAFAENGVFFRYHNAYCKGEIITNYIAFPRVSQLSALPSGMTPNSYLSMMHNNLWAATLATHGIYVNATGDFVFRNPQDMVPHQLTEDDANVTIASHASLLKQVLNDV